MLTMCGARKVAMQTRLNTADFEILKITLLKLAKDTYVIKCLVTLRTSGVVSMILS